MGRSMHRLLRETAEPGSRTWTQDVGLKWLPLGSWETVLSILQHMATINFHAGWLEKTQENRTKVPDFTDSLNCGMILVQVVYV